MNHNFLNDPKYLLDFKGNCIDTIARSDINKLANNCFFTWPIVLGPFRLGLLLILIKKWTDEDTINLSVDKLSAFCTACSIAPHHIMELWGVRVVLPLTWQQVGTVPTQTHKMSRIKTAV